MEQGTRKSNAQKGAEFLRLEEAMAKDRTQQEEVTAPSAFERQLTPVDEGLQPARPIVVWPPGGVPAPEPAVPSVRTQALRAAEICRGMAIQLRFMAKAPREETPAVDVDAAKQALDEEDLWLALEDLAFLGDHVVALIDLYPRDHPAVAKVVRSFLRQAEDAKGRFFRWLEEADVWIVA